MEKSPSYIQLLFHCLNATDIDEVNIRFKKFYEYLVGTPNNRGKLSKKIHYLTTQNNCNFIEEDVLNEILIEMLLYLRERPKIASKLRVAIPSLNLNGRQDLELSRNLKNWKEEVLVWIDQVMHIPSDINKIRAEEATKDAKDINEELVPIQRKAFDLINKVYFEEKDKNEIVEKNKIAQKFIELDRHLKKIFKDIANKKQEIGINELDKKLGGNGSIIFIDKTEEIWLGMPKLCFHFMIYWQKKAASKINSQMRLHSNTRKVAVNSTEEDQKSQDKVILDEMSPEKIGILDGVVAEYSKQPNPTSQSGQILHESIITLLYTPTMNAKEELKRAKNKQEKLRAQKKISKEEEYYKQNIEILIHKYSGLTQQEIVETINLTGDKKFTRDKVRGRLYKIMLLLEPLNEQIAVSQES